MSRRKNLGRDKFSCGAERPSLYIVVRRQARFTHDCRNYTIHALLVLIAEPRVGLRPGRLEPRALKRRTQQYPLMTKPRGEARAEIQENGHPKKQR